ncbi:MAG: HupE/UreJ family protein [Rhodocyclaceae bacterium]|nr:HupE/UreJ family protein [Rhodocyclaceae bacterium]
MNRLLAFFILAGLSGVASAHTFGAHGAGFFHGVMHPLLGADHLLAMLAVGLWASQQGGRALWAAPTGFVLAMVAGMALGVTGMALPMIEPMIAASVLVLGLLVTARIQLPWVAGFAVAAGFALFHGFAHGSEIPEAASPLVYAAGMLMATACLHAAGLFGGYRIGRQHAALVRGLGLATAGAGVALLYGV